MSLSIVWSWNQTYPSRQLSAVIILTHYSQQTTYPLQYHRNYKILTKSGATKFEGKTRARLTRWSYVVLFLERTIEGIGWLSLLLIRISFWSLSCSLVRISDGPTPPLWTELLKWLFVLLLYGLIHTLFTAMSPMSSIRSSLLRKSLLFIKKKRLWVLICFVPSFETIYFTQKIDTYSLNYDLQNITVGRAVAQNLLQQTSRRTTIQII